MDQARRKTLLSHLPPAGNPLLAVPDRTKASISRMFWHSGHNTWAAPVLDCGLVAWSKAQPIADTSLTTPLDSANARDRAHGDAQVNPGLLPQPGQPLLLDAESGTAHWMQGGQLMRCEWFDDGLLRWATACTVVSAGAKPDERDRFDQAAWTLREATPGGLVSRLVLQTRTTDTYDIVVANHWIFANPSAAKGRRARLHLRTENGHRLHVAGAVVLDRTIALDLAAQVSSYPSRGDTTPNANTVLVHHSVPDHHDGIVTTWRVDAGLAVLHDLRNAPWTVWLRSQEDHALTDTQANKLAGALVASVALLDRVEYLAVNAFHRDVPRYAAVRAEAYFAAAALAITRNGGA